MQRLRGSEINALALLPRVSAGLAAIRRSDRNEIAREGKRGNRRSHLIQELCHADDKAPPEAGWKEHAAPGRGQGCDTGHRRKRRKKAGLPLQKDVASLPLFAASSPRIGAAKRPR